MKYIVAGNYAKFSVTLTQKSGELIIPYIPTEGDVVQISLYGARRFDYPNYEQAQNVLSFEDNGCLQVGLYCLEVKITEANTHKLRCMYREQIRVVASNDDIPTDASFADDDVRLSGQFDIVASTEIVVDDELSLTSTNPVQNKVVTAAINTKGDNLESVINLMAGIELKLKRGDVELSKVILPFATLSQGKGGLMSAYDYSKLAALPINAELTAALAGKQDVLTFDNVPTQNSDNPVKSGGVYTALRDKLGKIDDGVYVSTQSGGRIDFYASGTQYVLVLAPIPNATTTDNGLMSASDYSKLEALPTNAELTTALNGKEDKVSIEAPVNSVDATQPITTLTTEIGKYYRIDVAVETLAITLPTITENTKVQNVVLYLTGGTNPAVTFAGGTIYYQSGFAIEAGKTYEINCLFNGVAWVVAAVEIDEV